MLQFGTGAEQYNGAKFLCLRGSVCRITLRYMNYQGRTSVRRPAGRLAAQDVRLSHLRLAAGNKPNNMFAARGMCMCTWSMAPYQCECTQVACVELPSTRSPITPAQVHRAALNRQLAQADNEATSQDAASPCVARRPLSLLRIELRSTWRTLIGASHARRAPKPTNSPLHFRKSHPQPVCEPRATQL